MSTQVSFHRALARIIGPCRLLVAPLLLCWLLSRITREQWELLNDDLDLRLVSAAVLFAGAALALNFYRWRILLRGENIDIDLWATLRYGCIGYASGFLLIGSLGGDVLKGTLLAKDVGDRRRVFFATAMDRLVGVYALSIITSVTFFIVKMVMLDPLSPMLVAFGWGATLTAIVGGVALHVLSTIPEQACEPIMQTPLTTGSIRMLSHNRQPLCRYGRRASFLSALSISLVSQSMVIASVYLVARFLNPATTVPTLLGHFLIVPFGLLAAAVPISPGGVGIFEASLQWMYELVSVTTLPPSGTLVGLAFNLVKIALAALALLASLALRPTGAIPTRVPGADLREDR